MHWALFFIDRNTADSFDSSEVKYISQEVLNKIKDKFITYSIVRIQSDGSVMCRFYCIAFTEYTIAAKVLLDYTILFFLLGLSKEWQDDI